ncbi:MAG: hypothetical protein AB2A00_11085 [Myxococcota bacterium]
MAFRWPTFRTTRPSTTAAIPKPATTPERALDMSAPTLLDVAALLQEHGTEVTSWRRGWLWLRWAFHAVLGLVHVLLLWMGVAAPVVMVVWGLHLFLVAEMDPLVANVGSMLVGVAGLAVFALCSRPVFRAWQARAVHHRRRILQDLSLESRGSWQYVTSPPAGLTSTMTVVGFFSWMLAAAVLPNLFQIPCTQRQHEAEEGLRAIAEAESAFFSKHRRYGTTRELYEEGVLSRAVESEAKYYRFRITPKPTGYAAVAVDQLQRVNPRHPRDAWVLTSRDNTPLLYLNACRE